MSDLPKFVEFHDEGPREGFQIETKIYPLADRIALIDALSASGLRQIQVGSFVSPKAVPTMADTPQLFEGITRRNGVRYTALWLNETGFRKAQSTPGVDMYAYTMFYTTDAFCIRNNNQTVAESRRRQNDWVTMYQDANVPIESAYILTAFGCNLAGEVPVSAVVSATKDIAGLSEERGFPLPRIILADTVGWANPESVKQRIGAVRDVVPDAKVGLHLHDTRGMGAANFYAALQMGVDLFDSSVAGLGGCPFANHASANGAGNICTEDMVLMCDELGIGTGIDVRALIEAALIAERILGRPLAGKTMHAGPLPRQALARLSEQI